MWSAWVSTRNVYGIYGNHFFIMHWEIPETNTATHMKFTWIQFLSDRVVYIFYVWVYEFCAV